MSGYSKYQKAEAARRGVTPYQIRKEQNMRRGLSGGQAVGKPKAGEPSVTSLVQAGKLPSGRQGGSLGSQPKAGSRQQPFGDQYVTTSDLKLAGLVRQAQAQGRRISINVKVQIIRRPGEAPGWATLSTDSDADPYSGQAAVQPPPPPSAPPQQRYYAQVTIWRRRQQRAPGAGLRGMQPGRFLAALGAGGYSVTIADVGQWIADGKPGL